MDSRTKLMAYVESVGGIAQAATALRTPLPTMYGVCAGWRGVGRRLAARWEIETAGVLKAGEMIWVRPTRTEKRTKSGMEPSGAGGPNLTSADGQ